MLEIAGGILIAIAVLVVVVCCWEILLVGVILIFGLTIIVIAWALLASIIGPGWAFAAMLGAGAGWWGLNAIKDSEWNARVTTEAATSKAISPYGLVDSIGFAMIFVTIVGITLSVFGSKLNQQYGVGLDDLIIIDMIILSLSFIISVIWHYYRFIKNYNNDKFEKLNLNLIAFGQASVVGFFAILFIPMTIVSIAEDIIGENRFLLGISATAGLALCVVVVRSAYREAIRAGLPSAGEY
ncbi:MAG: hypothetical protein IT553_00355 [Sphingomonadaceae bacterium]|nr:hypothetical protein [Sphingomonadaceae bacterium]